MKIYTLTLTYNRLNLLQRCITSIRNARTIPEKIIVVDNSDNSDTFNWCKDQKDITYIKGDNSLGVIARNKGMDIVPADKDNIIFQVDDDAWINPNYGEIINKYFKDSKVGAIGQDAWKLTNYEGFQTEYVTNLGSKCHMVTGYLYAWRTSENLRYDGINFPTFFREESDLCFQLMQRGYSIVKCENLGGHVSHRTTIDWEVHNANTERFKKKWENIIDLKKSLV